MSLDEFLKHFVVLGIGMEFQCGSDMIDEMDVGDFGGSGPDCAKGICLDSGWIYFLLSFFLEVCLEDCCSCVPMLG